MITFDVPATSTASPLPISQHIPSSYMDVPQAVMPCREQGARSGVGEPPHGVSGVEGGAWRTMPFLESHLFLE